MQNPGSVRGSQALSNLMQRLNDPGLVRPIQPCRAVTPRFPLVVPFGCCQNLTFTTTGAPTRTSTRTRGKWARA
jgi:hypothetical protein